MPNSGIRRSSTWRVSATGTSAVAGSPGPLARKNPSGASSSIRSIGVCAGSTWVSTPRAANIRGVFDLIPTSSAATRNRVLAVGGHDVLARRGDRAVEVGAEHRRARAHPVDQLGVRRPSDVAGEHAGPHRAPLAQVPDQRAGVDPRDADDPLRSSASSSDRRERQFDAVRDGSRTT